MDAQRASNSDRTVLAELEAQIVAEAASLAASRARLLTLVGEFDAVNGWIVSGAISCVHWLANLLDVELSTAREHVRCARALRELPETKAKFDSGALSYSKLRQLTRVATPETEAELLDIAALHPAGYLGRALAAWQERNDPDALLRRQLTERGVSARMEADGTVTITTRVLADEAAEILATLDAEAATNPTPATLGPADASADASNRMSLRRQRVDALCRLIDRSSHQANASADASREVGGVSFKPLRPELVLHRRIGGDTQLAEGTLLRPDIAQLLTCDCDLRVMTHWPDGSPADVGRRHRLITPRLRRLVAERDRHCIYPGCRATHFVQAHHIIDWNHLGPTDLWNLCLLCSYHHRYVHRQGWPADDMPAIVQAAFARWTDQHKGRKNAA
jgi:hypothetical protein